MMRHRHEFEVHKHILRIILHREGTSITTLFLVNTIKDRFTGLLRRNGRLKDINRRISVLTRRYFATAARRRIPSGGNPKKYFIIDAEKP